MRKKSGQSAIPTHDHESFQCHILPTVFPLPCEDARPLPPSACHSRIQNFMSKEPFRFLKSSRMNCSGSSSDGLVIMLIATETPSLLHLVEKSRRMAVLVEKENEKQKKRKKKDILETCKTPEHPIGTALVHKTVLSCVVIGKAWTPGGQEKSDVHGPRLIARLTACVSSSLITHGSCLVQDHRGNLVVEWRRR